MSENILIIKNAKNVLKQVTFLKNSQNNILKFITIFSIKITYFAKWYMYLFHIC